MQPLVGVNTAETETTETCGRSFDVTPMELKPLKRAVALLA